MLGKRKRGGLASGSSQRKKISIISPEEIAFDYSAREDYLTGFHKRKVQRIKHAQEETAKKEKEERIKARKILREGRKKDAEKHVEAVNVLIKKAQSFVGGESENSESESSEQEWDGITEEKPVVIDREDEYSDEDRHTTVTIEAVDITRDGFRKAKVGIDGADTEDVDDEEKGKAKEGGSLGRSGSGKPKRIWTKERPKQAKKKKKKFRYETKAERKVTRMKERSGGKAKAKARRKQE